MLRRTALPAWHPVRLISSLLPIIHRRCAPPILLRYVCLTTQFLLHDIRTSRSLRLAWGSHLKTAWWIHHSAYMVSSVYVAWTPPCSRLRCPATHVRSSLRWRSGQRTSSRLQRPRGCNLSRSSSASGPRLKYVDDPGSVMPATSTLMNAFRTSSACLLFVLSLS